METSIFHSRRRRLFMSSQPLRFRGNAMPTAMAPATWAACSRLPCEGAQQNFRCTDWSTKIPRMDSDNPQYTSMYWIYNIISYNHLVCNHQPTGVLSTAQICCFFLSLWYSSIAMSSTGPHCTKTVKDNSPLTIPSVKLGNCSFARRRCRVKSSNCNIIW